MPVQGNSFFSFTFSVIFVVSVSGFRDASFTFFFVQKNTKGTICNNQCIRICERLIIINYIELIIIIILRVLLQAVMIAGVLVAVHYLVGDDRLVNLAIISYMSAPATFSMQTFMKDEEGSAYVSTTNSMYCLVSILVYIIMAVTIY